MLYINACQYFTAPFIEYQPFSNANIFHTFPSLGTEKVYDQTTQ